MSGFTFLAPPPVENGVSGDAKIDAGTQLSMDYAMGRKRKITETNENSDEEDSNAAVAPPAHDIYRARQQKKVRWSPQEHHFIFKLHTHYKGFIHIHIKYILASAYHKAEVYPMGLCLLVLSFVDTSQRQTCYLQYIMLSNQSIMVSNLQTNSTQIFVYIIFIFQLNIWQFFKMLLNIIHGDVMITWSPNY